MRPIDASTIGKIERPASLGPVSQLQWLEIAALVIDPRYQREISTKGRRNVRAIAEAFSWSRFAPVVVAPVEGGGYAIVDGQHRTTAAAALGLERVPCLIIQADPGEQAKSFRAINAQTTRVHTVQLFKAAVASGEPDAVMVAELCAEAGVKVRGTPAGAADMKAGETLSVEALHRLAREPRRLGVVLLRGIRSQSADGLNLLRSIIIDSLRLVLIDHPAWWADERRFIAALDRLDLDEEWRKAMARKAREKGLSAVDALYARLVQRLQPLLESAAA